LPRSTKELCILKAAGGIVEEQCATKTILIIDDEDGVRESVREVLSDEGYRVVDTAGGPQVAELIAREKPALVLLDIWMPQMDGIGLLKEIKTRQSEIPVVMISGHGNIHTAVAATKLGAFDFMEKPLSLDALLSTVQRALGELPAQPVKKIRRQTKERSLGGKKPLRLAKADNWPKRLRQKTVKKSFVVSGQGLHSGIKTGLILHPLPPNSGVLFAGISGDVTVPAHLDYVASTGYATSLRNKGFSVATVEHLLAALHSYGIANLLVKVQGEVPILDGSAVEFCNLLEEAGIQEQDEECSEIIIQRPTRVEAGSGQWIVIEPSDHFSVHYFLDYPKPIGSQQYAYAYKGSDYFKQEVAPARTFGFLRDMERLQQSGLINGGKLNNCILIDDEKIVNTELRFPNEPARHKILDIIGDFYLLGRPIRGKITAHMTGHSDNIALLRALRTEMGL
jgi:UDP-3-O-[3-hydroxymyristoyl] N-acetylglucosamine deacetylase